MTEALARVGWALLEPFADPESRTFAPWLLVAAVVALLWGARRRLPWKRALGIHLWSHRTSRVDLQILAVRQLLDLLGAIPRVTSAYALATTLVMALDRAFGVPVAPEVPLLALSVGWSLLLFVAWDLSRWLLHRAMHAYEPLWAIHQVHHSAEVLTPLTFHRVHPLESVLYELRGVLVTGTLAGLAFWVWRGAAVELTLMGVSAIGVVLTALAGNLRHSHVWLSFGPVERWLLSPAQHQLHHARDVAGQTSNYGTWLACWDRLAGSWRAAPDAPVEAFGVDDPNHDPGDVVSTLVGPVVALFPRRAPRVAAALAALGLGGAARAEEPEPAPPVAPGVPPGEQVEVEGDTETIIVEARNGTPRVAGSAHVIGNEDLERLEYDDFTRVVGGVPGVYVRGEDGYGLRPNIGMRGANSDRSSKITLLEDGIPLAPAPYAAPAAYYFPMSTRLYGVEVFKGPAATRHGPQTIGGALNVQTRPVPTETSGAVDLALGVFETGKAHAWGALAGRNGGVLLELSHLGTGGFKELPDGGPTGFQRTDAMLKARWEPPSAGVEHSVDLKLGYGRERSHETYLGLSAEDFALNPFQRYAASQDDLMRWDRGQAELGWTARGAGFDVRAVAWHHDLQRAWTKLNRFSGGPDLHDLLQSSGGGQGEVYLDILRGEADTASPDQLLMIGTNDRSLRNSGAQVLAHHRTSREGMSNQLELGLRFNADAVARVHTEDAFSMQSGHLVRGDADTVVTLDSVTRAQALATHVHDDLRIGRVHVLPGLRVEAIRTLAGTSETGPVHPEWRVVPLPGGAVLGEIADQLDVFGGVHRGFSPVSPGSDPSVRPESAWSWEAGARATPGESHAEVVGFFSDYDNLTGQCTLSGGCRDEQVDQQFNGGKAWIYGVEALASHQVHLPNRHTVRAEASYTFTHAEFRTGFSSEFPQFGTVEIGDRLPYVPVHQGALQVFHEHENGGVAVVLRGRSALRDVAGQGKIADDVAIPGILNLDLTGDLRVTDDVRAYVSATNVVGGGVLESWRPFGARPSAPTQVMVGIKAAR